MPGWLTCAYLYGKFSSCLGEISAKSNEISPRRDDLLLIWAHYIFYKSFISLRLMRSHLGKLGRFKEILLKVRPISTLDLQTAYPCKVQNLWSKLHVCFRTISDAEQSCMCYFGWIQWQLFKCFYGEYFCFLMTLFLKMMVTILTANNPHCHSRLSKTILKILAIFGENILGKQLS